MTDAAPPAEPTIEDIAEHPPEPSDDSGEAVPPSVEELAAARHELELAQAAAQAADDRWKRSLAEMENYRKRARRQQEDSLVRAAERVINRLLPVLDSLDAALAIEEGSSIDQLREGISGTRDQLRSTLAQEGLEPIEALGSAFDPNLHEAVQMLDGSGALTVKSEFRRGYLLRGRVIRPSLVVVGHDDEEAPTQVGCEDGSGES